MNGNLFARIAARMSEPGKVAIECEDGRAITFADLVTLSGKAANALHACGVRIGDRVAIQAEKSPEMLIVYLGALRAGAILLPLNTGYTPNEVDYFVADSGPALLICRPNARDAMSAIGEARGVGAVETLGVARDGSFWERVEAAPAEFETVVREAGDLAAILYTSGTTGRSKGAMLSHDNLGSNAETLLEYWRFTKDDVLIHALPIFHTHGLFVATNIALMCGATMIFQARFDADAVMRAMPRATSLMGVPTFYVRLLGHDGLTREATAHMRLFISGSAPLLADTHESFRARTGHAILERYGMTETGMNTSNPYDGDRIAGTVGFPLPGVETRIADPETGRPLPQGEIGVIEIRGPNVFKGYWRMPDKTAAEFRPDGFFISGDIGVVDERGYYRIVGRAKDLIISGGYNVYPKEIESEIDLLPGVVESAVIGVAHPEFGEGVTAIVVPAKGARLEEAGVISALESRLARYKLPKRVFFVEDLPRNAMGKVQKNVLRETHRELYRQE